MSFTCPTQTALTDNELNQTFGNGTVQGLLPSSPSGASDRDGNGMLTSKVVTGIIASLKSSGIIPASSASKPDIFAQKQGELLKNIQAEYCFYEARYKYSLNKLFDSIRQGYTNNTGDIQAQIQKYLASTQALNRQMNDLTQIINAVTDNMLSTATSQEAEIKALNKKIEEVSKKLQSQNKIISSGQAVTNLNKQMIKYTEEKSKYTNNLLGLYSFLNIVALGLLVYVYKSSAD
jgi:hypothetical protein